jgi:hypothetical protein
MGNVNQRVLAVYCRTLLAAMATLPVVACERAAVPENRFYDTQIQPVLNSFCVGNTSPCHKIDPATNTALGNLDLSSFEAVHARPDVLRTYGSYPEPLLLLKSIPEDTTFIPFGGKVFSSQIRHSGGKPLVRNSEAFELLKRWLSNGATRTGLPENKDRRKGTGSCNSTIPADETRPAVDRNSASYKAFASDVQPFVRTSCSYSTCHGSPQSDFYLTCGDTDEQLDFNFLRVSSFVSPDGRDVEQSEVLLRPLDPKAGGVNHTGGAFFSATNNDQYKKLKAFAEMVQKAPIEPLSRTEGETFFGEHVMPVLIRRGCSLETCHSPNGFNDFRLRPGALGFMSAFAVRRNYETILHEFLSVDVADVRMTRLVRKNIFPSDGGIAHRGGALLESPNENIQQPCPAEFDAATATAFCTVAQWHRLEREARKADVSPLTVASTLPMAFISRPPNPDSLLEFDTFEGGADLKLADALLGSGARIEKVDNVRSALTTCVGLSGRTDLDVRGPEFSVDGTKLVFAARIGAAEGLDLWLLDLTSKACSRLTNDAGRKQGEVRVHNFDPVFAPNGAIVFASTRAGTFTLKRFLPNADLYRVAADLNFMNAERMTVLTNSELSPAFMANGQLSFTGEKATPDFYQLSGRRINWDLSDYHPLLAQRKDSDDTFGKVRPSVGYAQATEIREDLDRNFLMVLSNVDAKSAGGALALFNRSVGPFEEGRNEANFLKAMIFVDPQATGRPGTRGVYRSPYPTPNGEILASFAANVTNPAADVARYDLVLVDPNTNVRRTLIPGDTQSLVEPTLGYKRAGRQLFNNVPQLVFGGRHDPKISGAVMHLPDFPMLVTLLGSNLRRGRNVTSMDKGKTLRVYESLAPSSPMSDPAQLMGTEKVFSSRKLLGMANLESDGSLKVALPAGKAVILELADASGKAVFTMSEEHQMGVGEVITPGVPRKLFNAVCGGCHGSITGKELDVAVSVDALTGASVSLSRDLEPKALR